jgi:hypothetical protein
LFYLVFNVYLTYKQIINIRHYKMTAKDLKKTAPSTLEVAPTELVLDSMDLSKTYAVPLPKSWVSKALPLEKYLEEYPQLQGYYSETPSESKIDLIDFEIDTAYFIERMEDLIYSHHILNGRVKLYLVPGSVMKQLSIHRFVTSVNPHRKKARASKVTRYEEWQYRTEYDRIVEEGLVKVDVTYLKSTIDYKAVANVKSSKSAESIAYLVTFNGNYRIAGDKVHEGIITKMAIQNVFGICTRAAIQLSAMSYFADQRVKVKVKEGLVDEATIKFDNGEIGLLRLSEILEDLDQKYPKG